MLAECGRSRRRTGRNRKALARLLAGGEGLAAFPCSGWLIAGGAGAAVANRPPETGYFPSLTGRTMTVTDSVYLA